jgi:hypothetical protein
MWASPGADVGQSRRTRGWHGTASAARCGHIVLMDDAMAAVSWTIARCSVSLARVLQSAHASVGAWEDARMKCDVSTMYASVCACMCVRARACVCECVCAFVWVNGWAGERTEAAQSRHKTGPVRPP